MTSIKFVTHRNWSRRATCQQLIQQRNQNTAEPLFKRPAIKRPTFIWLPAAKIPENIVSFSLK